MSEFEPTVEQAARETAARAVFALAVDGKPPDEIILSSGIKLTVSGVPPLLVRTVVQQIETPTPPMWHNEEKGEDEPNPNDPDYLKALAQVEELQYLALADAALMAGTKVSYVPEGLDRPEDDGWVRIVKALRVKIDEEELTDESRRYLLWLRLYALRTNDDLSTALAVPMWHVGLGESEVQLAMQSFRGPERRGTDNRIPASAGVPSANGHRVPSAVSGDSAGNRRARRG